MTDIVGRLLDEAEKAERKGHLVLAEVCRAASDALGLHRHELERLRADRREAAMQALADQAQLEMNLAEIERLRRIPAHYGAPLDDPDAAIKWITGIMDDETRHLREELDNAVKARSVAIREMADMARQAGSWQGIAEGKDIIIRQLEGEIIRLGGVIERTGPQGQEAW